MRGSMVDIQSVTAENRRGKKKEDRRNHRTKIYWPHLLRRAAIIMHGSFEGINPLKMICNGFSQN